jgi:hypothetical protein
LPDKRYPRAIGFDKQVISQNIVILDEPAIVQPEARRGPALIIIEVNSVVVVFCPQPGVIDERQVNAHPAARRAKDRNLQIEVVTPEVLIRICRG